jgi:hypothetical protein
VSARLSSKGVLGLGKQRDQLLNPILLEVPEQVVSSIRSPRGTLVLMCFSPRRELQKDNTPIFPYAISRYQPVVLQAIGVVSVGGEEF